MSTLGITPQATAEVLASLKAARGQNALILFNEFQDGVGNYVFGKVERVNETEYRVRVRHGVALTDQFITVKQEKIYRVKREIGSITRRMLTNRQAFQLVFVTGKRCSTHFGHIMETYRTRRYPGKLAYLFGWTSAPMHFAEDIALDEIKGVAEVILLPEELEKE